MPHAPPRVDCSRFTVATVPCMTSGRQRNTIFTHKQFDPLGITKHLEIAALHFKHILFVVWRWKGDNVEEWLYFERDGAEIRCNAATESHSDPVYVVASAVDRIRGEIIALQKQPYDYAWT